MLMETAAHRNFTPDGWHATALGRWVALCEQRYCDRTVRRIFGYYALQLGMPQRALLRRSPVSRRAKIGREGGCDVRADPEHLPFSADSVDLIVLAHTLESAKDPHQVLREAVRVLRPEGRLIVVGFNPISLFGLRRLAEWRGEYPWRAGFLGLARLKDWLRLLDMAIVGGGFAVYSPPWNGRIKRLEKAGARWWPAMGGVYFVHAAKRIPGARLIMPKWRARIPATRDLPNPASSNRDGGLQ